MLLHFGDTRVCSCKKNCGTAAGEGEGRKWGGNLLRSRFCLVRPGSLIPALDVQGESKD